MTDGDLEDALMSYVVPLIDEQVRKLKKVRESGREESGTDSD